MKQQEYLNEYLENQISSTLWQSIVPNYDRNVKLQSEFKDRYAGRIEEQPDKIYFRKADWISKYSEAMVRSKVLMGNKK